MKENDPLRSLLDEWQAPAPSPSLDARVRAAFLARQRPSMWKRLWSFRINVPAPVLAAAVLAIAAGIWLVWPSPAPSPQRTAPLDPANGGYLTRLEKAGFQPLPDGEIRVIRAGAKQ